MKLLDTSVFYFGLPSVRALKALTVLAAAAAIALCSPMIARAQGGNFGSDCVPPSGSEYAASFHQLYAAGLINLADPIHDRFTNCDPPPGPFPGVHTVHSFGSRIRMKVSSDGGNSFQPMEAPAQVTVGMLNSGPDGSGGTLFDTEMLQLDISGGTLPPGTLIRESPTLASTGQTHIKPIGGTFHIDSFFDIFTELSVDGGQTWMPSEGSPGHMEMRVPLPTGVQKSTWGTLKLMYR